MSTADMAGYRGVNGWLVAFEFYGTVHGALGFMKWAKLVYNDTKSYEDLDSVSTIVGALFGLKWYA